MMSLIRWPALLGLAVLVGLLDLPQVPAQGRAGRKPRTAAADKIACTPNGQALAQSLDALDVPTHWLAGKHINDWRTGVGHNKGGGPRTHCSLFVAAVCAKLNVPMLNPPPQTFLSNRQQDWLLREGRRKGWRLVKDPVEAQWLANQGVIVLASYKSRKTKKAGHIAVVRPAVTTTAAVRQRGPRITQAGAQNYRNTDLRTGFRNHPGAWTKGQILYFAYRPTALNHPILNFQSYAYGMPMSDPFVGCGKCPTSINQEDQLCVCQLRLSRLYLP